MQHTVSIDSLNKARDLRALKKLLHKAAKDAGATLPRGDFSELAAAFAQTARNQQETARRTAAKAAANEHLAFLLQHADDIQAGLGDQRRPLNTVKFEIYRADGIYHPNGDIVFDEFATQWDSAPAALKGAILKAGQSGQKGLEILD